MAANQIAQALRRSRDQPDDFGLFFGEHLDPLVVFMARRVYDVDTALDLAAETLSQAFLGRKRFRGATDAEAAGWLYGIANRQLAQFFRRGAVERRAMRRLQIEAPRLGGEEEHARIVELAGLDQLRSDVRVGLRRLNEDQRIALRLRVVEELSYEELAEQLGISQQAARARVARGLKTLAATLERTEPEPTEGPA